MANTYSDQVKPSIMISQQSESVAMSIESPNMAEPVVTSLKYFFFIKKTNK